jgi:glutamine synthetase
LTKRPEKDEAIFNVLREYIKQSRRILFEGDGYSEAWEKAAKRGLSNFKTTPQALKARASKEALALFSEMGIMNHVEVEARYEIELRNTPRRSRLRVVYWVISHVTMSSRPRSVTKIR